MRRLITSSVLALAAIAALAGSAWAASAPVISSVSPTQVGIGGTLTIKGKNFKKGVKNNRVFFIRGDGKTVRARPSKASSTRQMSVKVPSALLPFLTVKDGAAQPTRFHIKVLSGKFSKATSTSRSPLIFPAGSPPTTGGGGTTTPPGATAADCDGDKVPNTTDTDDDNDLLPDDLEAKLGTDPCKADSDGDGIEDGFEYYSALDLNNAALPYPGSRPFPNALDPTDAQTDFDRDGLTDAEEFAAWMKYGNHALPLNYSAGKTRSDDVNNDGAKDVDSDGLSNVLELAKAPTATFNPVRKSETVAGLLQLDWLNPDTDGDTIKDGADDNDHDGLSNVEEITPGDDGAITDPEDPSSGSLDCDNDGTPNSSDTDDDNDGLPDTLEKSVGLAQCNKDTDGDGVEDGFEYYSAKDLNGNALPYPGSRPYPNALNGGDAASDFDGDGMTNAEEFAAWNLFGGRVLPASAGQSFPYSDGNQTSTAPNGPGSMDLDGNGRITDDEKDADGDGLPNWVELAKHETAYSTSSGCAFVPSTGPAPTHYANTFTSCNGGPTMPNANTFGNLMITGSTVNGTKPPAWLSTQLLNYLIPDTDGDGITDAQDDNDFDGLSNIEEATAGTDGFYTEPQDPCDPDVNARSCPLHA